jgi:hypothetical protein
MCHVLGSSALQYVQMEGVGGLYANIMPFYLYYGLENPKILVPVGDPGTVPHGY